MFCTGCGAQVDPGVRFCPRCGKPAGAAPVDPAPVAREFNPPAGCHAQTGRWIGIGWDVIKAQMLMFVLATVVMMALNGVVPLVLHGPLVVGMHIICWRALLGGRADIGDLFKGFNYFAPALIASLLIMLFTFLGALACLIGAVVVSAMYQFTYLFIVDRGLDFWPAMKASHAIVKQDYLGFSLFLLAMIGLHILGALACLVGLLVTIPLQFVAITAAYRDLAGFASPAPPQ